MAVIEAARNTAGIKGANSTEFGPCEAPVVGMMTEWIKGNAKEERAAEGDLGGTMRLGEYPAALKKGSKVAEIYGSTTISERHRHRYEVNMNYREQLEGKGFIFSGISPDGRLPEICERNDHPWFIGVQYHPELKSKPFDPHPLFISFIRAAVEQRAGWFLDSLHEKQVYADGQKLHHPLQEIYCGGKIELCAEKPTRAENVYQAVVDNKLGPVISPKKFSLDHITNVHDRAYVDFLQNAYEDWIKAGFDGDAFASKL